MTAATDLDDVSFERAYRLAMSTGSTAPGGVRGAIRGFDLIIAHARHRDPRVSASATEWSDTCAVCLVDDEESSLADDVARHDRPWEA